MRRKFLTSVLLSLVFVVSIFFGSLTSVFADGEIGKITATDFNETAWKQNLSNFESNISFTSESKHFESTVSTNDAYSGSYSTVFQTVSNVSETNDDLKFVVALGEETEGANQLYHVVNDGFFGSDDAVYIGFSAKKMYILDTGNHDNYTDSSSCLNMIGQYWRSLYDFYAWDNNIRLSRMRVKFEIVSGDEEDTLNIYIINTNKATNFASSPNYSIQLRSGLADGYLKFTQAYDTKSTGEIESYAFKNLSIDGTKIRKDELSVYRNTDLVEIINTYPTDAITLYDSNIEEEYVISNFNVYEYGLNEGEEVFSLTIKQKRLASQTDTHSWGLILGVDGSGDLSTGKEIKFTKSGVPYADSPASGGLGIYQCADTSNGLNEITYNVKGYVGGKVEVTYSFNDNSKTAVYNDVDFNGKIAFKIFNDSGLNGGYWNVSSVDFNGNASYTAIDFSVVGASIKTTGTQGLRFEAEINQQGKTLLEGLGEEVEYGILLSNDELGTLDVPCVNWFNNEQTIFTAVLVDLEDQHRTMEFTAKAYVKIDGVKYYTSAETRSIAQVANSALNDYRTQSEGEYVYEIEGKFYRVDYSGDAFAYLERWAVDGVED